MKIMKTPRSVDIAITNQCNLRCTYCSHFTSAGDVDQDLPLKEWLQFFKELGQCAVMDLTLEGGEPFCRKDLREIIQGIVENHMRYLILSNGTLITEDMAAFLSSTGRCNGVQVSVDGSTPATHDASRGQGTFSKAIQGIKSLQKQDIPVHVRVTINKYNIGDLDDIADLLLDEIGLEDFSTNAASYMGLCRQNAGNIQLSIKDRSVAMEALLKLNKKYQGRINASAGPLADLIHWSEMEKARKENLGCMPGGGFLTGCGGPMSKLAVRADGVMVPCIQLSHIELGRINRDSLQEIWQSHERLGRLRQRFQIPLSRFDFCKGCDYMDYCTGNCPALAYTMVGEENHPSPDACFRRFLEEGGSLPDER
ncbi:MAG: SynChlorMet cassette radical SAM/SPASM protein ScmE [bacterium]